MKREKSWRGDYMKEHCKSLLELDMVQAAVEIKKTILDLKFQVSNFT